MQLADLVGRDLGRTAVVLALIDDLETEQELIRRCREAGLRIAKGRVGSMDEEKVLASVKTAARREGLIQDDVYRHEHAIYHAIVEALVGITRGQIALGSLMRTVALSFAVVRGPRRPGDPEGDWIAVALFGTIGAPRKGFEHEVIGLGFNHI